MPWSQQGGTEESETNVSVSQQGGQADTTRGKAVTDYDLDIDYKTEGSDPDIKPVNEEKENSDAEYAKMELPQDIASEDNEPKSCRKDQVSTLGMKT